MKINRENYLNIQGWMATDLNLKGNELLIYACIFGFSQDGEQTFHGGLQYLAEWTNSTKQGVMKALKSLLEKGLIEKNDKIVNGVKFCEYKAVKQSLGVLNKVEQGGKQSCMGGIKQSLPNNKVTDNKDDNVNNSDELQETWKAYVDMRKKLKKPMTDYAQKLALKKLDELSNGDVNIKIKILNQSIVNSWQGLFPLKEEKDKPKFPQQKQYGRDETSFNIQEAENQAQNTNALNFGTVKRKIYKGKDDF